MNDLGRLESLAARYTIDRAIGAGGMATVYVADDVRHGRRVPQPEHIVFVENVFDELRAKLRK